MGRRGRPAVRTTLLAISTAASMLSGIPAAAQESVDLGLPPEREPDPVHAPLPGDHLRPPMAPLEEDGTRHPEQVRLGPDGASTPDRPLKGAERLPKEGGPNFDVFRTASGGEHVAVVFPEDVNVRDPQGRWVRPADQIVASPDRWEADLAGASVEFPRVLGPAGVVLEIGGERTESLPSGVEGVEGAREGDTVVYEDALPGVDLRYELLPGGYSEEVVLKGPRAGGRLSFEIQVTRGLWLQPIEGGGFGIMKGTDEQIGDIPAPVAYESSPEVRDSVPAATLHEETPGLYLLDVTLDESFLKDATYPIVIDPVQKTRTPTRDAYVNRLSPGTSYEGSQFLKVGSNDYYSFVRFDITDLKKPDRIVYGGHVAVWVYSQGAPNTSVFVRRVTEAWPGTLTWNSKPSVAPTQGSGKAATHEWLYVDASKIYQDYIDSTHVPRGVRLESNDSKTFYASEAGGNAKPVLLLFMNDLPNAPALGSPASGYVTQTESPTLKLDHFPSDPNDDDVKVQFQISDDPGDFTGQHLKWSSPWVDDKRYVIPAGVLTDGQDYWWRARSWDICDEESGGMCSLTDPNGDDFEQPASPARKLTVALKHFGDDPRHAMWSQPLGNDMTLKVNQSNGNLFLDVPLDVLSTPAGDLGISLAYNSQQTQDHGMGPGWDLAIGPASSGRLLPTALTDMGEDGLKIGFRDGSSRFFPKVTDHAYGATAAGTVRVSGSTYRYRTPDGGEFTFGAQGRLLSASPASTSDAVSGQAFTYTFNTSDRLTKVTDALGREVRVFWTSDTSPRLERITAWDDRSWDFSHVPAGLQFITYPPDGEGRVPKARFDYSGGRISAVRDARQQAAGTGAPSWLIAYEQIPSGGPQRVTHIYPPGLGASWRFDYAGPYKGDTAAQARIWDPRGVGGVLTDPYLTTVDFNWAGLPVRWTGPADEFGERPVTTQVWDTNNNLVCKRSPEANAKALSCTAAGYPDDLDPDGLSTLYTYEALAPYRLLTVTHPAAEPPPPQGQPDTRDRATESYRYDEGADFEGLWYEQYNNANLAGIPAREVVHDDQLDFNWGQGSPYGITVTDFWSTRLVGFIDIPGAHGADAKKHEFRIFSDDGVRFSVGGKTLLDCFGTVQEYNSYNCGTNEKVFKWASPGLRPFVLEFQERTGSAKLTVRWDKATNGQNETFITPGNQYFRANLGLVTTKEGDHARVTYTYPTADLKARRLPRDEVVTDLTPFASGSRTTRHEYDPDYGLPTKVTTAFGTSRAAETAYAYGQDPGSGGWCITQETDALGAVVTRACNAAGDVTSETIHVRAAPPQPAQVRTTTTTYDAAGRPLTVEGPAGGVVETTYDLAGRPVEERSLLDDAGTPGPGDDTWSVIARDYDPRGNVIWETVPHHQDVATPPKSNFTYDAVGNQLTRSDPRDAQLIWTSTYDALNRVRTVTSPTQLVTETIYVLTPDDPGTSGVDEWRAEEIAVASSGVASSKTSDLLGRVASEHLGDLQPTTYEFDVVGNVIRTIDPAGVWIEQDYDGFGQVRTERTPRPGGGAHTTSYAYDAAGNLSWTNGPRTLQDGTDDILGYSHDLLGRLVSSTYLMNPLEGEDDITTTFSYNDAGERIRVADPDGRVREWTYDEAGREATFFVAPGTAAEQEWIHTYDEAGRLVETSDPRGITLHRSYDAAGNLTRRWATEGQDEVDAESFTYDAAGNMTNATREADGATPSLATTLEHDDDGRLTQIAQGGAETTLQYLPPGGPTPGHLSSTTGPAGTTTYDWDGVTGLLESLTDPLTGLPTTYGYDSAGRPEARSTGALTWTRAYQGATGRIASQEVTSGAQTIASFSLSYDEAGNVTEKDTFVEGLPSSEQGAWTYAYDGAGRMTASTDPAGVTTSYGWDGAGNRTSVKVGASPVEVTTYDQAGLPQSATGGITYTHDEAGNLTGIDRSGDEDDLALAYDAWGRTTLQVPGTSDPVSYELDALGRVVVRTQGTAETAYLYVGEGESPAKVAVTGGIETLFAHAPSGPLAQQVGTGDPRLLISDLHTDVVGLADPSGTAEGARSFSPWGEVRESGMDSVLGFQGDLTDPSSGLVDMGTRLYAPGLGRFTARDILFGEPAQPLTLNQYAYTSGSPIRYTDPTGMGQTDNNGNNIGTSTSRRERAIQQGNTNESQSGVSDSWNQPNYAGFEPPRPSSVPELLFDVATTLIDLNLELLSHYVARPGLKAAVEGAKVVGTMLDFAEAFVEELDDESHMAKAIARGLSTIVAAAVGCGQGWRRTPGPWQARAAGCVFGGVVGEGGIDVVFGGDEDWLDDTFAPMQAWPSELAPALGEPPLFVECWIGSDC